MDVRKLNELCKETLITIEQVNWSKPTSKSLLISLLDETVCSIEKHGLKADDIMFTTEELVGLVKTGNFTEQQIKKFKSDHFGEAISLLEKVNQVRKNEKHEGVYFELRINDTGEVGGAKNKKHHFLKVVKLSSDSIEGVENKENTNLISYDAVQLPKASWLAKPFMSIELSSWRLGIFMSIPITLLLIAYFLFLLFLFTPSTEAIVIIGIFCLVVALSWKSIFPFYEANMKRIAIAPQWMMKWSQTSAQLESIKLDRIRKNGRNYRKLEFVIYEGVCPVCGNTVELENGKANLKGRLIGKCNESPREHLFSFDHITKNGAYLIK